MESNPSDKLTSSCQGVRPRRLRAAAPLPSMETIHGLWMMSVVSAESRRSAEIVARYGDHNGDGHLATTEHEAGIEWVTGHRLGSGHRYGSGCGLGFGS